MRLNIQYTYTYEGDLAGITTLADAAYEITPDEVYDLAHQLEDVDFYDMTTDTVVLGKK